jgi:FAD/FMN-containing dehydrogenase
MRRDSNQKEANSQRARMTITANLASRLAETIGANRVVSAPEELAAYAVGELVPAAIVRPASAEEAAETVRFAVAERLAVLPLGSRSKSELGMPPKRYDIAMDLTALREIAHYDARDLTLGVDAGMPLRELEIYLKKRRQFLPLAVPCFESTTVGGTIASGIDSALRLQNGTARDFLIGAEFVDGTGEICKSGGRVVKNVTGYDLHKLLIGSLGTLGIITRLNFRTFPVPDRFAGHLACFGSCEAALEYQETANKAGLALSNLEVLHPNAAEIVRAILRRTREALPSELEKTEWCVYASFEGNEEVVKRIGQEMEKMARKIDATCSRILEEHENDALGGMLRECFEWLRWASPANLIYRLALPEVKSTLISELSRIGESNALRPVLLLRAARVVYFAVLAEKENEEAQSSLARTVSFVRAIAHAAGGHATLLNAPLSVKQSVETTMAVSEQAMQHRVKLAFDPSGVFVPGRLVGGI